MKDSATSSGSFAIIALLSAAGMALEVVLVRVLSFTLWYHFAFLVVSLAVLGFGVSGMLLHLRPEWQLDGARTVRRATSAFTVATLAVLALLALVPFDPFRLFIEPVQILVGLLYVLGLMLPFLFLGIAIGTILTTNTAHVGSLYGADLAGAAVGAVLILIALPLAGGAGAIAFAAVLASVAAVLVSRGGGKEVVLLSIALSLVIFGEHVPFRLTADKMFDGEPVAQLLSSERREWTRWNAMSRTDVIRTRAGGRSIIIDGGVAALRVPMASTSDEHLRNRFTSIGFALGRPDRVAVIGSGAGWEAVAALAFGARSVTAIEVNGAITEALAGPLREATGDLYDNERIDFVTDEARSYLERDAHPYDVIVSAHTVSNAATSSGALNLAENHLLTIEAMELYFERLNDDGVLFITRPRAQLPRLFQTGAEALRRADLDPSTRLAVVEFRTTNKFFADFTVALVAVKNPEMLATLPEVVGPRYGHILHSPIQPAPPYADILDGTAEFGWATDDHPFFNQRKRFVDLRPSDIRRVLSQAERGRMALEGEPVAEVSVVLLFFLTIFAAAGLTIWPLRRRKVHVPWNVGAYFGAIGIAFLFAELGLVHRLGLLIGPPTLTFAVVVAGLLLGSGLGSALASRFAGRARLAVASNVIIVLAVGLGAAPIADSMLAASQAVRISIGLGLASSMGVMMGTAFPLGMRHCAAVAPEALGAAWGINGFSSVVASVLCIVVAATWGYSAVFWVAAVAYACAAALLFDKDGP